LNNPIYKIPSLLGVLEDKVKVRGKRYSGRQDYFFENLLKESKDSHEDRKALRCW
jgi:hypothetical protein